MLAVNMNYIGEVRGEMTYEYESVPNVSEDLVQSFAMGVDLF